MVIIGLVVRKSEPVIYKMLLYLRKTTDEDQLRQVHLSDSGDLKSDLMNVYFSINICGKRRSYGSSSFLKWQQLFLNKLQLFCLINIYRH